MTRYAGQDPDFDWMDASDYEIAETLYCFACGDECTVTEECFDYSGTHCTNGKGGTHHTGEYSSDCCGAEFGTEEEAREAGND